MKYFYHITPEVLIAKKQERCQGFACYNKIEEGQIYFLVSTEFINKGIQAKQNLCVKCIQEWFKGKMHNLAKEVTDLKSELGKVEMLADKYYGEI